MKCEFKLFLLAGSALITTPVLALPTVYPTDVTLLSSITNNTNSNLVSDSVQNKKVYVMPPNSAAAEVGKKLFLRTTHLGMCREMADLQSYSRQLSKDMADYQKRAEQKKKELDAVEVKRNEARQDFAKFATISNLQELADLDERIAFLNESIREKSDLAMNCTQNCNVIISEIKEDRTELNASTARRRTLARQYTQELKTYEKLKKSVEGYDKQVAEIKTTWSELETDIENIQNKIVSIYKTLGSLEGAQASLKFTSNWDENVARLRDENPEFEFEKIHTQNAVVTTSLPALEGIPSAGAIKSYGLSVGTPKQGMVEIPSYPEQMSGTVTLSLIGACPIEHPEYFDLNPEEDNSPEHMNYGMTVSYEFPTAFTVSATAKYNMYKMYQKIVKSGSKGGFFRKKSWSSVEEKTFFRDEFKVEWKAQDQSVDLTEAQKTDLEQEMRHNIFGRLAAIGLPAMPNPGALVAPTLPPSGAMVLGNALAKNKACQKNVYCAGATIAVNVLDAIFGSSLTTASYKNIQDVEMKEEWSRTSVVYKPWVTSYVK